MKVIIYWILDLEDAVHSTWDLWISGPQKCKGNSFFEIGQGGQQVSVGFKISEKKLCRAVPTTLCHPLKVCPGGWWCVKRPPFKNPFDYLNFYC